ncbi:MULTISPECIES: hypothetical protein [unclassified Bradyrhizobium]|uniref:hypothetical protein n=1 Tax=unclassified Bradyrhizobium TaxID=2631580 RepID=UPI0003F6F547|nr:MULTISPECIES: hypothetical protein [unclassified Bradyrhizobium]MCP3466025.1 hypothetical protein [Bradyrhizobium sp. CCGUVB23]
MSAIRWPFGMFRTRHLRGLLAVLVATIYLLSCLLHGAHELDVTNPSSKAEIASVLDGAAGHNKAFAGHHCHGCFSVTVAQPAQAETLTALVAAPEPPRLPAIAGVVLDTDSPPPKLIA